MAITQPYFVVAQEHKTSKFGTEMVQITLLGIKDRLQYTTYVDKPNHNYKHWQHVIDNANDGFVLDNLKTKTHKDKVLINADSKVVIAWQCEDKNTIIDQINDIWNEEDRKASAGTFRDLFQ